MFYYIEFGKLQYVLMLIHHTMDTYPKFQWASALSSKKVDSEISHLLETAAPLEIPMQFKADDYLASLPYKM